MAKTARILGVTVRQIENDYKRLGLRCFSDASDEELLALTTTFLGQQHLEPLKRCPKLPTASPWCSGGGLSTSSRRGPVQSIC